MSDPFDIRKTRASDWFRELRDQIVAAFETLEDSQTEGPFADLPPGRFEVAETRRASDDGSDTGGGLMERPARWPRVRKGRRQRLDRLRAPGRGGAESHGRARRAGDGGRPALLGLGHFHSWRICRTRTRPPFT